MAHYLTTLTVPAPAPVAFDAIARFSDATRWDPLVTRARMLTAEPVGLGSRFELVVSWLGLEQALVYELTAFEPGKRLELVAETEGFRSHDTVTVAPGPGAAQCTVSYEARIELRGLRRLGDPLLHLAFQVIGRRSEAGLRRFLGELGAAAVDVT